MSLIHGIVAHANGGLTGIQSTQRDWSPFLVHFTSASSMAQVKDAIPGGLTPAKLRELLSTADDQSYEVVNSVSQAGKLLARKPAGKPGAGPSVSLSECTLPGLIALSERYGRFGFGFRKNSLFAAGARPCAYLGQAEYSAVKQRAQRPSSTAAERQLYALSNTYHPPGAGGAIKDFTHEREWRVPNDVLLDSLRPEFLICPTAFVERVRGRFPSIQLVFPIDLLFEWGA